MRKILPVLIVLLLTALVSAQAQSTQYGVELRGSANYGMPAFDFYDYSYGVDLEYRNWFWDPVGFAMGVGVSSWKVKADDDVVYNSLLKDIDGQLTTIPFGPSIIYKVADTTDWNLTVEAGVRYVVAQSGISYRKKSTNESGTLDVNDSIIGVFGLDVERYFGDGMLFFVGGGYQMDIDKGSLQVSDLDDEDNELEAFFVRVGTKIQF